MPAPKGNQNASKRIEEWILEAYVGLVAFGYIGPVEARDELGVSGRRWIQLWGSRVGPPSPYYIKARRRFIRPRMLRELAAKKRERLLIQIERIRLRP